MVHEFSDAVGSASRSRELAPRDFSENRRTHRKPTRKNSDRKPDRIPQIFI